MRVFIVVLLSCASVVGTDSAIQVFTTAETNAATDSIYTKDFYTRDSQTNLVRRTKTKAGDVQIRIHRFYHDGALVADYIAMADSSGFITEASTPYTVSFECGEAHTPKSVVIGKDGVVFDAFSYTNGLFFPVEGSLITKANEVGSAVQGVMEELNPGGER